MSVGFVGSAVIASGGQALVSNPIPFWGDGQVEEDVDGVVSKNPWDVVYIAGIALPGVCEIKPTGAAAIEVDVKKPKGANGATVTILGYMPKTFDIVCKIWTAEHWQNIQGTIALVWKGSKATKKDEVSIAVRHPALQLLKIDTAVIIGLTPPVDAPEPGFKIITFHMHERVTAKGKVTKTATGVSVVQQLRNDHPPANVADTPPGSDRNFTGPFPK